MKYQIRNGWPIGGVLIPADTIIDLPEGKPEHLLTEWERLAKGRIPPHDAIALDDETYALMVKHYETPGAQRRVHRR
jgi:hypothetical protein